MTGDIVVIGAGVLGLSTALHCALLGRSVIVLERDTAGSQASGRAAGLFKSVQADELRTIIARRSIDRALRFGDWAGAPLPVTRSGSFLVARTDAHRAWLRTEARQSGGWGVDVTEAAPGALADAVSCYRGDGTELALWCPEDCYIEEPMSLVRALALACREHGVELAEGEPAAEIGLAGGGAGTGGRRSGLRPGQSRPRWWSTRRGRGPARSRSSPGAGPGPPTSPWPRSGTSC